MTAGTLADAAAGKKVVCEGKRVPVTERHKTICKPLRKAFPKPKKIDIRLAHLRATLRFDASKLRGRKGKRTRSLQGGFGAAGKRAHKTFLRGLPKALALIDRPNRRKARPSRIPPGPALASAGCSAVQFFPVGESPGGRIWGAEGPNGKGGRMERSTGGLTFRVTWVACRTTKPRSIPDCPTASGAVDGDFGSDHFEVTTEVRDADRVLSRQSTTFDDTVKARGQVGADARLEHIDIASTAEVFIVATGGIVKRGGVERRVRS